MSTTHKMQCYISGDILTHRNLQPFRISRLNVSIIEIGSHDSQQVFLFIYLFLPGKIKVRNLIRHHKCLLQYETHINSSVIIINSLLFNNPFFFFLSGRLMCLIQYEYHFIFGLFCCRPFQRLYSNLQAQAKLEFNNLPFFFQAVRHYANWSSGCDRCAMF